MTADRERIAIWGASGHALVVADIISLLGSLQIAAYIDNVNPERWGTTFAGCIVGGGDEFLAQLRAQGIRKMAMAVGDCQARVRLSSVALRLGFELATLIHPGAIVAKDVVVGQGTVIAAQAAVNPGCVIGENVIINTSASVDHECRIDDGAHIAPGARLAARVNVGACAWVGIGAIVKDRVTIGARALVGAGALVLEDLPPDIVAYGAPAKVVRRRSNE